MDKRTDKQIVEQSDKLAIEFMKMDGWEPSPEVCGFKTYRSASIRAQRAWKMACVAQEVLTGTSPEDALSSVG